MSNQNKLWPTYTSKKTVKALEIVSISEAIKNNIGISITSINFGLDYKPLDVVPIFIQENNPAVGGYIVFDTIMPQYLSKELFENNFTEIKE